jgi:alkylation response protein AidB-like acyl-CoA dehydrogenase
MFSAATRHLVRREGAIRAVAAFTRSPAAAVSLQSRLFASLEQYEDYGKHLFTGKVAEAYLSKQGASADILNDPTWVAKDADVVAQAVFEWYWRLFVL